MFKLLLATDDPDVLRTFSEIRDWDRLGYRTPRTAANADEAVDSLTHHHADAVLIAMAAEEEQKLIHAMSCPHWHLRPIMHATANREQMIKDLNELEMLLGRTHADYSNDPYSEEAMMQLTRHEFFRKVISGREGNPDRVRKYLQMLRSRMDPDRPCVLLKFDLPDDDGYLASHWNYGPDRLEVAMRNIFGAEKNGVRMLVSVQDDERIALLACPMLYHDAPEGEALETMVIEHTQDAISHVKEYLGIDMRVASDIVAPNMIWLVKNVFGAQKETI